MPTLKLTKQLIERASITPNDEGCQQLLADKLSAAGFTIEHLPFDNVKNLWATHGTQGPVLCFVGHTDVVPPGDESHWQTPPFTPTEKDGHLYGRGAADMKGSVASMITAGINFVKQHPNHQGTLAFLITSDEEGKAIHGIRQVVEHFKETNQAIDWAVVGEPSSENTLGDTLKNGRRGSLSGDLTIFGKQGHIAYPELADNPIPRAMPALHALCETTWDEGNDDFPPTSFQISNISAGTGANNVIPETLTAQFNLRFSPLLEPEYIKDKIETVLRDWELNFEIDWHLSGLPFFTDRNSPLISATIESVKKHTDITPQLSTIGGTSDGRFIAQLGTDVIELGPINKTIHQIDECVNIEDLNRLTKIYEDLMGRLLIED